MTSAIYDFKAIKAATLAFPKDHPQDVVKPQEPVYRPEEGSHVTFDPYADGVYADYSCWAGWTLNGSTLKRDY